jgi:predicted flap endonuclease-1-like 5' DNA nuclease
MWDFILQIIYFLIIAGIIGAIITFVITRLLLGDKAGLRLRGELETKILGLQHDLDKTSGELRAYRDRLESIEIELGESANVLKDRDAQLKELQDRLVLFDKIETELAAKKSEVDSLQTELSSLRTKLEGTEARLKKPAQADRISEIESLKKNLAGKENEISLLLNRVKELAPLNLQIKDRELRIRELERKYADELNAKDSTIANLSAQINDLESKLRLAETNSPAQAQSADAATEIVMLKRRINELETMHILAVHPPPKDQWDDLVAISDRAPAPVKMLHRLGIYNFKQVAIWDDDLIDWIDSQLERSHGRIRSEHWVENAKNEHFKKYGERL